MMDIYIIGAKGFAQEVEWLVDKINMDKPAYNVVAFVDRDDSPRVNTNFYQKPVISESYFFSTVKSHPKQTFNVIIAIGNPQLRKKVTEPFINHPNLEFPTLIDPSVIIDCRREYTNIGKGVIICASSTLTTGISIGNFTHINLDSTLGHNDVIGNYVTISPGAHISGDVEIEDDVFIGCGAVIIEKVHIGQGAKIGAGAVVIKDLPANTTAVGVPAKMWRHS